MAKVALAGCGRIAFLLEHDPLRYKPCTHLGALRQLSGKDKKLRFVACYDPDFARARAAQDFLHAHEARVCKSYGELLRTRPDLLVIASSTCSHFALLKSAIEAAVPRIVIEKPVAVSVAEVRKLRRLARRSASVILPNYERRYHPKYIRLKQQLARRGARSYRGFFAAGGRSLYPTKGGDEGVLLHDTTHLLDLVQYLFGPVKKFSAVADKMRHVLHLEHMGGAAGLIETVHDLGVFHLELEVRLRDRRITVGNGFYTTEKIAASRHYRSLKSYAEPQRRSDPVFPVAKNPFVQLYREALYGTPNNGHFFDALANAEILCARR